MERRFFRNFGGEKRCGHHVRQLNVHHALINLVRHEDINAAAEWVGDFCNRVVNCKRVRHAEKSFASVSALHVVGVRSDQNFKTFSNQRGGHFHLSQTSRGEVKTRWPTGRSRRKSRRFAPIFWHSRVDFGRKCCQRINGLRTNAGEIVSRFELSTEQNGPVFQEVALREDVIEDALLHQKHCTHQFMTVQCVKIIRKTAHRGCVDKNRAFEHIVAIHQIEGLQNHRTGIGDVGDVSLNYIGLGIELGRR